MVKVGNIYGEVLHRTKWKNFPFRGTKSGYANRTRTSGKCEGLRTNERKGQEHQWQNSRVNQRRKGEQSNTAQAFGKKLEDLRIEGEWEKLDDLASRVKGGGISTIR